MTAANHAVGGAAALLSAAAWALGPILVGRLGREMSEAGMNFFKCALGTALLGAAAGLWGTGPVDLRTASILVLSGVVGISLGDTLFFGAIVRLGPKLTVIVSNIGPALTVLLAVMLLGERPTGLVILGMVLTLGGATAVMWRRTEGGEYTRSASGILWLLGASLCTAVAVILAKVGVRDISALAGTAIRVGSAGVVLGAVGGIRGSLRGWLQPLRRVPTLVLAFGTVLVSMSGFWLFLLALKYTDASVVTVLSSTTPLFVLPISALVSEERIARPEVVGAVLGTAGVALIFLAR